MLTETTTSMLKVLSRRGRVLTGHQIGRTWYSHTKTPKESARRTASILEAAGFVKTQRQMIASVSGGPPLLDWTPGQSEPSFQRIAWANATRWNVPLCRTLCVTATKRAHSLFGGSPRRIRPRELEHDVLVSEVFLRMREQDAELAKHWIHEDALEGISSSDKRPDAIIECNEQIIVDVLGRGYDAHKIERLWKRHNRSRLRLY